MNRSEVMVLKQGDKVVSLVGKERFLTVVKIEMDAGAYNGWVTCTDGTNNFLYAGEEILRDNSQNGGLNVK